MEKSKSLSKLNSPLELRKLKNPLNSDGSIALHRRQEVEILVNLTNSPQQQQWFDHNEGQVEAFLNRHRLTGIELIFYGNYRIEPFPLQRIKGLHLNYWPTWLDFWRKDEQELLKQFDSQENVRQYYGDLNPQIMVKHYREELEKAQELGVEYLVFHVSHIQMEHIHSRKFTYSDWEVMEAASQLINQVFQDVRTGPLLLFENLWWPGLNFLDPELTTRFFNLIDYPHKGFMLDTGHLMLTNPGLANQEEACHYILEKVEKLGDMKKYIKGIHLNKSLIGNLEKQDSAKGVEGKDKKGFWEKYIEEGRYILRWDQHLPFDNPHIKKVVEAIGPKYLVFELLADNLEELGEMLTIQNKALRGKGK